MEQLMEGICAPTRPDAGLEDRAIKRLRQAPRPRPSRLRFVAAAAAVVFLGGVGGVVRMVAVDGGLPLPGMGKEVAEAASKQNIAPQPSAPDALNLAETQPVTSVVQ